MSHLVTPVRPCKSPVNQCRKSSDPFRPFKLLEGKACYASILLAPAEGICLPFGQKKVFHTFCVYFRPFLVFTSSSLVVTLVTLVTAETNNRNFCWAWRFNVNYQFYHGDHVGPCQTLSYISGLCQNNLDPVRLCYTLQDPLRLYQTMSDPVKPFGTIKQTHLIFQGLVYKHRFN